MANINSNSVGSFRNEMMNALRSLTPYSAANMVDMISIDNPKYKEFYTKGARRDELLLNHSVSQGNPHGNEHPMGGLSVHGDYHSFMYANVEPDKQKRLNEYRLMAAYDFVNDALDEICDEFVVIDDKDEIINLRLEEELEKVTSETLHTEFKKVVKYFDLENKGWEYLRSFLTDGELYFENIIHKEHVNKGILGIMSIPTESIDPIFNNVQNLLVRGYLLRKPIYDPETKQIKEILPVVFDKNQVTYFHSTEWDSQKKFRVSHVEKSMKAYKQLNMIEDSIVIHRMVNAPEKLVFNVDIGNLPPAQGERYIQQLAQRYWSKKTYDSKQGGVNMFNPQSMLDAFWFPKRSGSEGTSVTKLPGGQNLGDLPDLAFFSNKLYKSLGVPTNRLTGDSSYSDGTEMLREELKFARLIIRFQRGFSEVLKNTFITHLKLRGWWDEFKLKSTDIKVKMNEPTHFNTLRDQQNFELRSNNYATMASSEGISETLAQKKYLEWDDKTILANREWQRKDAAHMWELEQIRTYGPNWKKLDDQETKDAGAAFDGGGAIGGGAAGSELGEGDDIAADDDVDDVTTDSGESIPPTGLGTGPTSASGPEPTEG